MMARVLIAFAVFLMAPTVASADHKDILIIGSKDGFDATVERLEAEIAKRGITIFARIDHHEGAKKIGLELAPARTYIIGNPKVGTPVMQANPMAALDFPLKIAVVRDGGKIFVSYREPESMTRTWHLDPVPKQIGIASNVLNQLANIAAGRHLVGADFAK